MKTLLMVTIFLTNIFSAEYTYSNKNSTKIDMHGGKTDTLVPSTNTKSFDVKQPLSPLAPKILIEDEKKKEEKKENKK